MVCAAGDVRTVYLVQPVGTGTTAQLRLTFTDGRLMLVPPQRSFPRLYPNPEHVPEIPPVATPASIPPTTPDASS